CAVGIAEQKGAARIAYGPFEHRQKKTAASGNERRDVWREPLSGFFENVRRSLKELFARKYFYLCRIGVVRIELDEQTIRPATGEDLQPIVERFVRFVSGPLFDHMLKQTVFCCIHVDHAA